MVSSSTLENDNEWNNNEISFINERVLDHIYCHYQLCFDCCQFMFSHITRNTSKILTFVMSRL